MTIGDRLKLAAQRQFVGRRAELQLFEQLLADSGGPRSIVNVHGPGGVGKSTLLDVFRACADAQGAAFLYLDAPDCGNAELFDRRLSALLPASDDGSDELFARLRGLAARRRLVIAIDTFEESGDLNRWLRQRFLPALPDNCLVVIAGRHALADLWQCHQGWDSLIHPLPLNNFDHALTRQYLRMQGITDATLIERAWHYTAGHPLALSLSAALRRGGAETLAPGDDAAIVSRLTRRWLRELPEAQLRPFVEAAAMVRHFNQDLLEHISDQAMGEREFQRLQACSFVRRGPDGWSLHGLVRDALAQELAQRSPERYRQLRMRALCSLAQTTLQAGAGLERGTALQDFFFLLGDSLVRAALYSDEGSARDGLYLEGAAADDIEALERYMQTWRVERGVLANADVELFDRRSGRSITQQIIAEPREPEFLNMRELVELFPGAVRLLRDQTGQLHGLNIVLPINAATIAYLEAQPVTGRYFSALPPAQRQALMTPPGQTCNWFVRLIDTRDPGDNGARAVLFRDLAALLIKPARFVTTTPLALYQALLTRFGFRRLALAPHSDFGKDRPAPFFELDLRGQRLAEHLTALMRQHLGVEAELPIAALLASMAPAPPATAPPARHLEAAPHDDPDPAFSLEALSQREREVALAAVEGLPNGSIAAQLQISEATVKKHMGQIFRKLGVRNRAALIRRFWSQPR